MKVLERARRDTYTLSNILWLDLVSSVAMSEDGRTGISAFCDKTRRVWHFETGKRLATSTCDGAAGRCAFSDARKLIVVGDAGGRVHFLRLEEPKAKSRPLPDERWLETGLGLPQPSSSQILSKPDRNSLMDWLR
jgi:WD40 repeat protein